MPRPRTGTIITRNGVYYARVRFTDEKGRQRAIERKAETKSKARQILAKLLVETTARTVEVQDMTFAHLAEIYLNERVQPAIYSGDRKVAGMRAQRQAAQEVNHLRQYWDAWQLQDISYAAIESYKRQLLATKTYRNEERKISGVNHALRRMRAMLNFAIQNRWLSVNPFRQGAPLISVADETPRNRPRQPDEEERLLAQCTGRRAHLRAIVICAIDTAMRHSEILRTERRDVDLERRILTVRATVSKTATERQVPISDRLAEELQKLLDVIEPEPEAKVFGGIQSIRKAFRQACVDAKIPDLHFHDLRHWATTDMVNAAARAGLGAHHVQKITGHSQMTTFRRYIRTDESALQQMREALANHKLLTLCSPKPFKQGTSEGENEPEAEAQVAAK